MVKIFNCVICGCRDFQDYDLLEEKCLFFLKNQLPDVCIISGGCSGADRLAEIFANKHNLQIKVINANWEKYGRSAGPKRNEEMVKLANGVIAFWDYKSRGTKSTINLCKKYNVNCKIVNIGGLENE